MWQTFTKKGGSINTTFSFTPGKDDLKVMDEIRAECESNGIKYSAVYNNRGAWNIKLSNCSGDPTWFQNRSYHPFITWTRQLGIYGQKSHNKEIPNQIMAMSRSQIQLFLSRLFSTDGCVQIRDRKSGRSVRIRYRSSSEVLIRQIKELLASIGIHSLIGVTRLENMLANKKQTKIITKHDSWVLEIPTEFAYRFLTEVGIYGKEDQYESHLTALLDEVQYNYSDVREYIDARGLKLRKRIGTGIFACVGSRTVAKKQLRSKIPEHVEDFFAHYKPSCYNTTFLVGVKSLSGMGELETCDITVDKNACFFGNLLSHNCSHRTTAGTMIFNTLDRFAFMGLQYKGIALELMQPDELPLFDLILTYASESGAASVEVIEGVTILDGGKVVGLDQMNPSETYSFMAMRYRPLRPLSWQVSSDFMVVPSKNDTQRSFKLFGSGAPTDSQDNYNQAVSNTTNVPGPLWGVGA